MESTFLQRKNETYPKEYLILIHYNIFYSNVIPTLALSKSGTVETIVSSQPVSQAPDTI